MLIGISGKARSGKDTCANAIVDHFSDWKSRDQRFIKYSFAAPIKEACNLIFGWDERHSDGPLKEMVDPFWGVSPRYAYQTMGTEWGRTLIHTDLWVKRAEKLLLEGHNLIIPDVRFPNELEFVRRMKGTMIYVKRPNAEKAIELNTHASEAGLDHLRIEDDIVLLNRFVNPEDPNKAVAEYIAKIREDVIPIIEKRFTAENV